MKIIKISFFFILLVLCSLPVLSQVKMLPDSIVFSGVVFNRATSETLPNVTCRYSKDRGTLSDGEGCFRIRTHRGDTVLFTFVGFKPCTVVIPDTLSEREYMIGIFMSPDTIRLSEALILRRWGALRRQKLINAQNNMRGILKQAYSPVQNMDADMNQRMMLNDHARSIEMKGLVDVGVGVGTQSVEAYKMLRMQKRIREKKEWLNPGEIDLLKKLYYIEKKENRDN